MVFLGETLTLTQTLALCSIIAASMGSTLTMRPEPKVEKISTCYILHGFPPCRIKAKKTVVIISYTLILPAKYPALTSSFSN
jgi:hypothetical protein